MIQIDIEMPKCCDVCMFSDWSNLVQTASCKLKEYEPCFDRFSDEYRSKRADFCPLHEVTADEDTVSRQDVINVIEHYCDNGCEIAEDNWCPDCQQSNFVKMIKKLPPAQPETHEERTETHACDLISRQAAIDAVKWGITYARAINTCTGETKELFKVSNYALNEAVERLKKLPSAQPEPYREEGD